MQPLGVRQGAEGLAGLGRGDGRVQPYRDGLLAQPGMEQALGPQQLGCLSLQGPAAVLAQVDVLGPNTQDLPRGTPGADCKRFIGGEPMKLATKVLAGRL